MLMHFAFRRITPQARLHLFVRRPVVRRLQTAPPKIALLMDGDQVPPSHAPTILAAVRERGDLVGARWFGVPGAEKHSRAWILC